MKMSGNMLCAATILTAGLCATAASATDLTITGAGIYQPGYVEINGPGYSGNAAASALELNVTIGGAPKTLYVFCVDLAHDIYLNNFETALNIVAAKGDDQSHQNLTYQIAPLKYDSVGGASGASGAPLTATQIADIGNLTLLGQTLIKQDGTDLSNQLAGVQAAIWEAEYTSAGGYTVTPDTTAIAGYATQYLAQVSGEAAPLGVQAIYDTTGAAQGFAAAVPEPAAWTMMILGAGLTGVALRRRRAAATRAAIA